MMAVKTCSMTIKKQFQISEAYRILDNLFINSKVNLKEDINLSHSVYHIIKRHIFIKLNLKWLNLIMQIQSLNLKPTMAYNQNVVCIIFWSHTEAQWDQHCLNRVCPELEVKFGFSDTSSDFAIRTQDLDTL